jgi:hypothetical protein
VCLWLKYFGPSLFAYSVRYKNKLQNGPGFESRQRKSFFLSPAANKAAEQAANKAAEQAAKKAGTKAAAATIY